jgi:hypothetical protein
MLNKVSLFVRNLKSLKWFFAGFAMILLCYFLLKADYKAVYFKMLIFFLIIYLLFFSRNDKLQKKKIVEKIIMGILIFIILFVLRSIINSYSSIPIWDYLCFYLFGNIGAVSRDFYNPEISKQVFDNLNLLHLVHDGYISEIVNVGFWYPPTSMIIFLPLSYFDLQTGYIIWQSVMILALLGSVILILKIYFPILNFKSKILTLRFLSIFSLTMLFPSFTSSISTGQTLSMFLCILLLAIININNYKSGILIALLIIIKPLGVLFALYFLFKKKWKSLLAFSITSGIILIITIMMFGYQPFVDYFLSSPTSRIPSEIFYEEINQSLNAVILRLYHGYFPTLEEQYFKWAIYLGSLIIVVVTIYKSVRFSKQYSLFSFIIYIPMALLVYPGTLSPSIILLLPVVISIYNQKLFQNKILNLLGMLVLYSIGSYSFFSFCLIIWTMLIFWPKLIYISKRIEGHLTTLLIPSKREPIAILD